MNTAATVSRRLVPRIILAVVALVVAAWLGLSLRNERIQVAGIKLMARQPPETELALQKFRNASQLSASQQPELFEAGVRFAQGRREQAIALLRSLLAKEPDNRSGWALLSEWLEPTDPQAAAAAAARARALDGRP